MHHPAAHARFPIRYTATIGTMSDTTTDGIRVQVEPTYVAERSSPREGIHFFAYRVTITNMGQEPAQLISRRWVITDGSGRQELVEGPGVVGKQPRLEPGQHFTYVSFCPLPTPVGSMQGSYFMRRDDGAEFTAEIDAFVLAAPHALN